jgi:UDP-N-acetylglucosamine 2-epimerase (non-hydrolysing)
VKITHVVGARPNFPKMAPVYKALAKYSDVEQTIIHTGQHSDRLMSEVFLEQLVPTDIITLLVGIEKPEARLGKMISELMVYLLWKKPDIVLVYGDVDSTLAAAIAANKCGVLLAHVEAGLRSWDRSMPEEINRVLVDNLADILYTPSIDAVEHLLSELVFNTNSCPEIVEVGNTMIDTVMETMRFCESVKLKGVPDRFVLATFHRPSNVDDQAQLIEIVNTLNKVSETIPVVFPVHPRTSLRLAEVYGEWFSSPKSVILLDPQPYVEFLALQMRSALVITDSGGIQEETSALGIQCLTVRENTERPITIEKGTNRLVKLEDLVSTVKKVLDGDVKVGSSIWDGKAGPRIAAHIHKILTEKGK